MTDIIKDSPMDRAMHGGGGRVDPRMTSGPRTIAAAQRQGRLGGVSGRAPANTPPVAKVPARPAPTRSGLANALAKTKTLVKSKQAKTPARSTPPVRRAQPPRARGVGR